MSKQFVSLHPGFISEAERIAILSYVPNITTWETYMPPENVWYNRLLNYPKMPSELQDLVGPIRKRVKAKIIEDFKLSEPLYADTLQIVRWFEGNYQDPHADAANPDGSPHPFPWRAFASIIYLNSDYEGGQIYFPDLELTPKVQPGTLAFFPGTTDFIHGVAPVTAGIRYTLASFFTFDSSKHDGGPI